jgi:hypothetical protein
MDTNGSHDQPEDDAQPESGPTGAFPERQWTIAAVQLYVQHMLEFANYHPDGYFDAGTCDAMIDGSIRIELDGRSFRVRVEAEPDESQAAGD